MLYLLKSDILRCTPCSFVKYTKNKIGVINDPLGQAHSHASSKQCFLLFCFSRFEKWGRTDVRTYGRTTWAKTMNPTGRDFGLIEWINKKWKEGKFSVFLSSCANSNNLILYKAFFFPNICARSIKICQQLIK